MISPHFLPLMPKKSVGNHQIPTYPTGMSEGGMSSFTCLLAPPPSSSMGDPHSSCCPLFLNSLSFSRLRLLLLLKIKKKGEEEEREGRREAREDFLDPLFLLRLSTYIAAWLPKVAKLPGKTSLCFFISWSCSCFCSSWLLKLLKLK